jgi:hypothetical protein
MSFTQDQQVLYTHILQAQANTCAKEEHLAQYLISNTIVEEYLYYYHTGKLPSQVLFDESNEDYL